MKNIFAHQIGKLRTERHLSQTDVAKRLYVSRQAVSKWENGDAEPSLDNLIALAKLFNVSLDNLITGQYDPTTTLLKISHLRKPSPGLSSVTLTSQSTTTTALPFSVATGPVNQH